MHKLQRGDTIVEVLLAMSVIGMVLGSAFGIADRNLSLTRATQERTEALKVAESEIDLLKIALGNSVTFPGNRNDGDGYCLKNNNSGTNLRVARSTGSVCKEGLYTRAIKESLVDGRTIYGIQVTWQPISSESTDVNSLNLYYKPRTTP